MTKLNVHEAKTHLSKYLAKVEEGEDVILCRNGMPIAKIIPFSPKKGPARKILGVASGKGKVSPGFFEPLTDEEMPGMGL